MFIHIFTLSFFFLSNILRFLLSSFLFCLENFLSHSFRVDLLALYPLGFSSCENVSWFLLWLQNSRLTILFQNLKNVVQLFSGLQVFWWEILSFKFFISCSIGKVLLLSHSFQDFPLSLVFKILSVMCLLDVDFFGLACLRLA